jgi:hypothetical protein
VPGHGSPLASQPTAEVARPAQSGPRVKWRGLAHVMADMARRARGHHGWCLSGVSAVSGAPALGVDQDPRLSTVGPMGSHRAVKEGRDSPAQSGDGEVEWRLGVVAHSSVLTREGVGGNVGEI